MYCHTNTRDITGATYGKITKDRAKPLPLNFLFISKATKRPTVVEVITVIITYMKVSINDFRNSPSLNKFI